MIKNTIKFTHPDSSIIYNIINSLINNNELFNIIRPIPHDVLDKDIEIWCINNWSCKHDIFL